MGDNKLLLPIFSKRQRQIIEELCKLDHREHKEIAYDMGLAYGTIKIYLSNMMRIKLGWNRSDQRMLVLWVMQNREKLVNQQMFHLDFEKPEDPIFGS